MTVTNSLTSSPHALGTTAHSRTTSNLSASIVTRSTTSNSVSVRSALSATSIKI